MIPTFPCPRRRAGAAVGAAVALATAGLAAASTEPPASEPDVSAAPAAGPDTGANPAGCVDDAASGADAVPRPVHGAARRELLAHATPTPTRCSRSVRPARAPAGHTYVLVQCGTEAPALEGDLDGADGGRDPRRHDLLRVDVATTASSTCSTSRTGSPAWPTASWVVTPEPARAHRRRRDRVVQPRPARSTPRLVVAADPDVYVTGGYDDPAHETLVDAGVPVVANAEWLETSPEGWAEWVGLFAALTNTEAAAQRAVRRVDHRLRRRGRARRSDVDRPTDRDHRRTCSRAPGTPTAAAASSPSSSPTPAATIVYDDDPTTGSIELDIETVLADGADGRRLGQLATPFTAAEAGRRRRPALRRVRRVGRGRRVDQQRVARPEHHPFEQGPVMIDDYLLDYIKILHPELAPDHELVFFSQAPAS